MLTGLLILLAFVSAAFLLALDRRDKRAFEERQADRLERAGLTERLRTLASEHAAALEQQAERHRQEVQVLCQRIQAPEHAVVEHQQQTAPPDESWPLSEEESAERHAAVQVQVAEIERLEREGVMS